MGCFRDAEFREYARLDYHVDLWLIYVSFSGYVTKLACVSSILSVALELSWLDGPGMECTNEPLHFRCRPEVGRRAVNLPGAYSIVSFIWMRLSQSTVVKVSVAVYCWRRISLCLLEVRLQAPEWPSRNLGSARNVGRM